MRTLRYFVFAGVLATAEIALCDSLDGYVFLFPISSSELQFKSYGLAESLNALSQRIYEPIGGRHSVRGPQIFTTSFNVPTGAYSEFLEGPAEAGACYSTQLEAWAFDDFGGHRGERNWEGPDTECAPTSHPTPGDPPPVEACDHCTGGGTSNEPLILDLNGDGIFTTDKNVSPVWFDLNGNGIADRVAWTDPAHEDAFLCVDWNGNRQIDGGRELFGDATIKPDGTRASHGYEALGAYDERQYGGNADGEITTHDPIWLKLRLWVDRNHDGLMTRDENYTLGDAGVVGISLDPEVYGPDRNYGVDANGNLHFLRGTFSRRERGTIVEQSLHEVWFSADVN